MTVQELVSLSRKLNQLCHEAELELGDDDSNALILELKQRLRAIEEATRLYAQ